LFWHFYYSKIIKINNTKRPYLSSLYKIIGSAIARIIKKIPQKSKDFLGKK
jgi:hypothetical protein